MKTEYESVLFLKDKDGRTVGFYRNHIESRAVKLYTCSEMSLDEIKEMHEKINGYNINESRNCTIALTRSSLSDESKALRN